MRRAFADTLLDLGRSNDRVIFLTGDLGFQVFDGFRAEFPRRYLNVGVAEAHLIDCAAGLALEGWRPIVYSIASFLTGRAFEQLRLAVGYHRLPVMVVGAGGGYTYASSGVTHHAKEDAALMALIEDMTIVLPGDPGEVAALMPQLVTLKGPSYIRIGRFGEPRFPCADPVVVGQGRIVRDGDRVAILTTGNCVIQALEAVEMLAATGKKPMLCHFHTVRPLDTALLERIAATVQAMVMIEDHGRQGGFHAAVAGWAADRGGGGPSLHRLGPGDGIVLGNPHHDELRRQLGYDGPAIARRVAELWHGETGPAS
jgi:transketolase